MKPQAPADFRPALAAAGMLALLAGAYEAALQLPQPVAFRSASAPVAAVPTDTATLANREAEPTPPPTPAPEPPPCPTHALRFELLDLSEWRPVGLHHYVGTVGGRPATALLEWPTILGGISGTFYLHRGGPTCSLSLSEANPQLGRPARPVLEVGNPDDDGGRSEWRLTSWPGAVLRGTWHDTTGNHPVLLRESYAGAVRADVQMLKLVGGQLYRVPYSDGECRWGSYRYAYLQFPGPWAVAPTLRRTLGPPPAVMRRRVRTAFEDAYNNERLLTEFLLNDFNLLSYRVVRYSTMVGDEHGDSWTESYLFDLTTGRELTLASQLRLDYGRPLDRLIRQHLLHDPRFNYINRDHRATWVGQDTARQYPAPGALPEEASSYRSHESSVFLTGSGLTSAEYYEDDEPGPNHEVTVTIPYRELRPLVRSGTPLARMLRARGLW